MAGEWLKFEKSTPDKPEVFAIAAITGLDPDAVVGKLLRVWSWFDTHTESGNASLVTSLLLDRIAGVTGFCEAMQSVGWLVADGSGVMLPKFDRHNGATAKHRADTARRVARFRACNDSRNDQLVTSALAREEKRREEVTALKATGQQAAHDDTHLAELRTQSPKHDAPVPSEGEGDQHQSKRISGTGKKHGAEHFPKFWAAYPVKKGKADALKKWKLKGCDAMSDQIVAHVRRMESQDDDWLRGFIPHGSTYINGERWEDEPKKDKLATAPAPPPESFGAKAALAKSESKLENALAFIRQQRSIGAYGEGEEADTEMRRLMAEATEKYRGQ